MNDKTEGLCYSALDENGHIFIGWICGEDCPSYDDAQPWADALNTILSLPGIKLQSVYRCSYAQAMQLRSRLSS